MTALSVPSRPQSSFGPPGSLTTYPTINLFPTSRSILSHQFIQSEQSACSTALSELQVAAELEGFFVRIDFEVYIYIFVFYLMVVIFKYLKLSNCGVSYMYQ